MTSRLRGRSPPTTPAHTEPPIQVDSHHDKQALGKIPADTPFVFNPDSVWCEENPAGGAVGDTQTQGPTSKPGSRVIGMSGDGWGAGMCVGGGGRMQGVRVQGMRVHRI